MYTENQLTSFGNYLLKEYNVQVHSNDGKNQPLYQRQVHHADHCNWLHESPENQPSYLPSTFQVHDKVVLQFGESALPLTAYVLAVHFTASKVRYDLDITIGAEQSDSTRIYNVDSCFVKSAIEKV